MLRIGTEIVVRGKGSWDLGLVRCLIAGASGTGGGDVPCSGAVPRAGRIGRVALGFFMLFTLALVGGGIEDCGGGGDADGDGLTVEQGDCDDNDPNVHPLAMDVLDGRDNDCDGVVDRPAALVAAGTAHSMARIGDPGSLPGDIWTWGRNEEGELGDGSTASRNTPAVLEGLPPIRHMAAGNVHSLAVDVNGQLWAWGDNQYGQLGDGSATTRVTPVQVATVAPVTTVAAGERHSLAVLADGTVWAWGGNDHGQLGNGSTAGLAAPTQVEGLSNMVAVAAGSDFSLALQSDGTVWAWGHKDDGQLGIGTTVSHTRPVQVSGIAHAVAIAAGGAHGVALVDDGTSAGGTVWAWGWNWGGQLGDGTTIDRTSPVRAEGLSDVVAIAAGGAHTLAIRSNGAGRYGELWGWGLNYAGQVGDGTSRTRLVPVRVEVPGDIVAVAGGFDHSLAMRIDGTVWAWGDNADGQAGRPSSETNDYSAHPVTGLEEVARIEAGRDFTVALQTDGTVWTWGADYVGNLGQGDTGDIAMPTQVRGLSGLVGLSVGYRHTLVFDDNGVVWAWGEGISGQLGNGETENQDRPVQVQDLTNVVAVAAGYAHSLGIVQPGDGEATELWAWGSNGYGQLGNGANESTATPVQVLDISNVTAVAAGERHSLALLSDGTVWAWGDNEKGQLGNGTDVGSNVPVQVLIDDVVVIGAGENCSFAARSDGTAWAWGTNYQGQLGDGTTEWRYTPVRIDTMDGLVDVESGYYTTVAAKADGTVWAWGANDTGQLGQGTFDYTELQLTPLQVPNLENIVQVSSGFGHSTALDTNGLAWAWGSNSHGQLGNGATLALYHPDEVAGLP